MNIEGKKFSREAEEELEMPVKSSKIGPVDRISTQDPRQLYNVYNKGGMKWKK